MSAENKVVLETIFTARRYATTIMLWSGFCLTICPSVRLSQSSIISSRSQRPPRGSLRSPRVTPWDGGITASAMVWTTAR